MPISTSISIDDFSFGGDDSGSELPSDPNRVPMMCQHQNKCDKCDKCCD